MHKNFCYLGSISVISINHNREDTIFCLGNRRVEALSLLGFLDEIGTIA